MNPSSNIFGRFFVVRLRAARSDRIIAEARAQQPSFFAASIREEACP